MQVVSKFCLRSEDTELLNQDRQFLFKYNLPVIVKIAAMASNRTMAAYMFQFMAWLMKHGPCI